MGLETILVVLGVIALIAIIDSFPNRGWRGISALGPKHDASKHPSFLFPLFISVQTTSEETPDHLENDPGVHHEIAQIAIDAHLP